MSKSPRRGRPPTEEGRRRPKPCLGRVLAEARSVGSKEATGNQRGAGIEGGELGESLRDRSINGNARGLTPSAHRLVEPQSVGKHISGND